MLIGTEFAPLSLMFEPPPNWADKSSCAQRQLDLPIVLPHLKIKLGGMFCIIDFNIHIGHPVFCNCY